MLVACILETAEAVANLQEVVAVPGLDVPIVGKWDLCLALGLDPLAMPHTQIEEIIDRLILEGSKRGVAVGLDVASDEDFGQARSRGVRFLFGGSDYSILAGSSKATVSSFRSLAG